MPSFAGFYATQDECQEWLRKYAPEIIERNPRASTRAVDRKAQEFMRKKRVPNTFFIESVPLPGSCALDAPWVLMLSRRSSKHREYLAPDPERDFWLRELVESEFGLKISEWAVIWYSGHDPNMLSEFLTPETLPSEDQ